VGEVVVAKIAAEQREREKMEGEKPSGG